MAIYTPKTEVITAFRYGHEPVPKWLEKYAEACSNNAQTNNILSVRPIESNPDHMPTFYVRIGEYIVLQPNGGFFHYKTGHEFLSLLFSKRMED